MSQYHRKQLIEESFAQAEKEVDGQILMGPRWARVFGLASKAIGQKADFKNGVDFQDYVDGQGFPDTAAEWAIKNGDRVQQDPIQAMSDWIDYFPRARVPVDNYCAARAQEDLARLAQTARPNDLASPEEALALRRNRGRAM